MKPRWSFLAAGNAGTPEKCGNTGNSGNAAGKLGISTPSAAGNRLVTPVTNPEAVTKITGSGNGLVTQKPLEKGSCYRVTAVTGKNGVTGDDEHASGLPTPEELSAWGEYLLERAAIMEHDGELSCTEADRLAWAELLNKYPAAAAHFAPGGAA